MTEYIIRPPEKVGSSLDLQPIIVGEIVRCRDCEHGIKADLSGNWYECMKPDGNGDYARWDVEPNGFCAWGIKRKEGGDD